MLPFTFHWYVGVAPPLVGVAVKVTEVPAQTGLAEAAIDTLTGSSGFTVMVTVLEVAGLPVGQVAFEVRTQVIVLPLAGIKEYVVFVAPGTLVPFSFHWYVGVVPPLVGVAVNVTEVPAQTGLAEAAIDTVTGSKGLTVMVTVFDVAGLPVGQVALEVRTQVTRSLLVGA